MKHPQLLLAKLKVEPCYLTLKGGKQVRAELHSSCLRTGSEKVLCHLRNLGERTVITQIFMGSLYCMSH